MTDQELVTREILIHRAGEIGYELVTTLGADMFVRQFEHPRILAARMDRIYELARHAATYALDALGREP